MTYYIKQNDTDYALLEEFSLEKRVDQFIEVIPNAQLHIKPVSQISDKFIFMTFGLKNMIVKRPNSFELN